MKYKLVKASELEKLLRTARDVKEEERDEVYNRAYEDGKQEQAAEVEELQDKVDTKTAELKKLRRELSEKNIELEVFAKQKSDARAVVTKRLENEEKASELNTREMAIYKKEEKLEKREKAVAESENNTEDKNYKTGYADGVADGVRKISEITQVDRQNAMDIAMVSAASHTKPEIVKEVLDGSKAIKSSLANKEDK